MRRHGIYKWATDEPAGPGSTDPCPPEPGSGNSGPESELDIEKRWWLQAALDPDRFDRFYDKYHGRIFAFAYWRTGDEDTATDVTAETFLTAWDKRHRFRWQGYTFGAWLFQIARGVISHRHRRDRVRGEVDYDPVCHGQPANGTPETDHQAAVDAALINACLDRLSDSQREVIVLHHFVGLALRQIAHATRTPQGTVNSHLRRGKEALRRCLEENGAENGLSESALRIVRQAAVDESKLRVVDGTKGDDT